jgi:hypothetical protein
VFNACSNGKPSTNVSNSVMARKKLVFFKSFLMMELEILRAEHGKDNSRDPIPHLLHKHILYPPQHPYQRSGPTAGCGGGRGGGGGR